MGEARAAEPHAGPRLFAAAVLRAIRVISWRACAGPAAGSSPCRGRFRRALARALVLTCCSRHAMGEEEKGCT